MPLQRRLPKRGFLAVTVEKAVEVRLGDLVKVEGGTIDLASLKKAGIVNDRASRAKIILAGEIKKAFKVEGIGVTKGAKAAIEAAGGSVAALAAVEPAGKLKPKSKPQPKA
jgi:large subunit ribosomal protein L15